MKKVIVLALFLTPWLINLFLAQQQTDPVEPPIGQIAYVGTDGNVWILDPASGNYKPLTNDANERTYYLAPHFSPDGSFLAACHHITLDDAPYSENSITIINLESMQTLGAIPDASCEFDWSPSSHHILYTQNLNVGQESTLDKSQTGIWLYDLDSAASTQIIPPRERPLANPAYSPDGSWIFYYEACFECVAQFTTYNVQGGNSYDWSSSEPSRFVGTGTSWSPDGGHLAFDQLVYPYIAPRMEACLFVGKSDGSEQREIYRADGRSAAFPLWSHSGGTIAFSSFTGYLEDNSWKHRGDLMLIKPDGSDLLKVFPWNEAVYPLAWSPDDRQLIFAALSPEPRDYGPYERYSDLMMLDVATGTVKTLAIQKSLNADWGVLPTTLVTPTLTIVPPTETAAETSPTVVPATETSSAIPQSELTVIATWAILPTSTSNANGIGGARPETGNPVPGLTWYLVGFVLAALITSVLLFLNYKHTRSSDRSFRTWVEVFMGRRS